MWQPQTRQRGHALGCSSCLPASVCQLGIHRATHAGYMQKPPVLGSVCRTVRTHGHITLKIIRVHKGRSWGVAEGGAPS